MLSKSSGQPVDMEMLRAKILFPVVSIEAAFTGVSGNPDREEQAVLSTILKALNGATGVVQPLLKRHAIIAVAPADPIATPRELTQRMDDILSIVRSLPRLSTPEQQLVWEMIEKQVLEVYSEVIRIMYGENVSAKGDEPTNMAVSKVGSDSNPGSPGISVPAPDQNPVMAVRSQREEAPPTVVMDRRKITAELTGSQEKVPIPPVSRHIFDLFHASVVPEVQQQTEPEGEERDTLDFLASAGVEMRPGQWQKMFVDLYRARRENGGRVLPLVRIHTGTTESSRTTWEIGAVESAKVRQVFTLFESKFNPDDTLACYLQAQQLFSNLIQLVHNTSLEPLLRTQLRDLKKRPHKESTAIVQHIKKVLACCWLENGEATRLY